MREIPEKLEQISKTLSEFYVPLTRDDGRVITFAPNINPSINDHEKDLRELEEKLYNQFQPIIEKGKSIIKSLKITDNNQELYDNYKKTKDTFKGIL